MTRTAPEPLLCLDHSILAMSAASAEALHAVADYDEQGLWKSDGATSMSSWLAARYQLGWGTAREWVRVARALRRLPRIAEAYASGRLSWDQLKPLTSFPTAETDGYWSVKGPTWRPWSLQREASRHRRIQERELRDARAVRSLATWWDPDGTLLYLEGTLPAEESAAVQAALESRAQEIVLTDPPQDPAGARLADALVELVCEGSGGAQCAVLVVHADAEVLAGVQTSGPFSRRRSTGSASARTRSGGWCVTPRSSG